MEISARRGETHHAGVALDVGVIEAALELIRNGQIVFELLA